MKHPKNVNELINSGITLTDTEAKRVEAYLYSIQSPMSRYQMDSAVGRVVAGLPRSFPKG
jgi:hypothetical protein